MANPIQQRPLEPILAELIKMGAQPNGALFIAMRDMLTRSDKTTTNNGAIQSAANVTGRTEPLSSTLQNVTSAGQLSTADAIAADGSTFGRVAITALTANQPDLSKAGVINKTAANISETTNLKWRTAAHSTAQPTNIVITGTDSGGGHASISYPAFNLRVPTSDGLFVDIAEPPGLSIGLLNSTQYFIFMDDPNFNGTGSLVPSTDPNTIFQSGSRFYSGVVTTPVGGGGPTTGKPGGQGGGLNRATVLA